MGFNRRAQFSYPSCQQLEVELDTKLIVDLINSNNDPDRVYSPLLHDGKTSLAKLLQVKVTHVFREANKCADFLAKRSCSMQDDFTIFEHTHPPKKKIVDFLSLPHLDMCGVYFCRLASPTLVSVTS